MLLTPWFCFAVLKPLVEMTTIHYKPFENSPHKCHPLSAVSTPRTQGIFKKPNLQLSEILLNSYLFAAGSFCAIPLLCIGAEINHRPCTPHQYDFRPWARKERRLTQQQHRQSNKQKRENINIIYIYIYSSTYPGPWSSRGGRVCMCVVKGLQVRCELRSPQREYDGRTGSKK